jgi:serine acetyltransferase
MNYILFDSDVRSSLLPFTYTRPVADIRIGILTIREKWEKFLGFTTTSITEEYLEDKYPMVELDKNILINASFLPTKNLVKQVSNLTNNQAIFKGEQVIAFFTCDTQEHVDFDSYEQVEFKEEVLQIKNTWDIFSLNDKAIQADFDLLTEGRTSQPIPVGVHAIQEQNIFIEQGATVSYSSLNASNGPIYIGENSEIGCGCTIDRGSMSNTVIGKNSFLDNQIHIAHNVKIGDNSIIAGQVGIAGSSIIGNNVRIGGQAGISGHLTIGNNVEIAGGSGVIKDITDNSKVMGYPAKNIRDFLKDNK